MAAPVAASPSVTPADPPNETLTAAIELGHLSAGAGVEEDGSLGNGPAGAADVEWYTFTLDRPALMIAKLGGQEGDSSFDGVLSLFNNDPFDFYDLYDLNGHRLLDQADAPGDGGVATLDRFLGPGTYYLAVSGAGNFDFNPLLADSGLPGSTGDFALQLAVDDPGLAPASGPQVLSADPAPFAVLDSSPLAIRIDLSGALDPATLIPDQTVRLIFSPSGTFGQDDQEIPLASINFSPVVEDPGLIGQDDPTVQHDKGINELQLFPESPLAPGYYQVFLAGRSVEGSMVLADPNGNDLNASPSYPDGQDFTYTFQVDGIDGRTGDDPSSDDTAATAHDLGNLSSAGIVRVAGAIGVDPFYNPGDWTNPSNPGNQVDLYHFTVSGPGLYALVAEVFAGRIGSPLDPGVSLFELDPTDGSLQFIAGNNNTYDPVKTTDGFSTPLYTDSALYASLTDGDYYLAVADGSNTTSPLEGQPTGSFGLFDPNVSHSGQAGWSTGAYVLNVLVQPTSDPPHVVSTSPSNGAALIQPPSQLTVTFDEPVNLAQLAFQTYLASGQSTLESVYIEGADGTDYFPRFASYDIATNQATFTMLGALSNGDYRLHLSGAAGLTDLGGNVLAGNDQDGDYVVSFTVEAPARGTGGNTLEWSDLEPNDTIQDPQDLGVLFPDDFAAGAAIGRDFHQDPIQAPRDTADVYKFQILMGGWYSFALSGANLPDGVTLSLNDPSGRIGPINSVGGTLLVGQLVPGTYLLTASGWDQDQAAGIAYQLSLNLLSANDNAPPLLSGPAPAVAIRFSSDAPPTTPTSPRDPISPPPPVTPPPLVTPPSSGSAPAPPVTSPSDPETAIELPARSEGGTVLTGSSSLGLVALAASSVGGVSGFEGSPAGSTQLVQSSNAISVSPITTGLIVVSTSFPLLGHDEVGAGTPQDPEPVKEAMTTVEMGTVDIAPPRTPEIVGWLTATIRGFLVDAAMSRLPALEVPTIPEVSTRVVAGLADHAVDALYLRGADHSAGLGEPIDESGWGRVWTFAITCGGLAAVLYARSRETRHRVARQEEESRPCPLSTSTNPSSRSIIKAVSHSPLTLLRTVRGVSPLAAPTDRRTRCKSATFSSTSLQGRGVR